MNLNKHLVLKCRNKDFNIMKISQYKIPLLTDRVEIN